jgi:MFS transporter, DHA1 family, multidrug resistance protein
MPLERRVLVWMCVLVGINQLGFGAMIPSLPLYAQSFGVPASAIGLAVAVYGLARFFIAVPSGRLADGLGRRPTLAIGGLVSAIGNFWCAWATSYPEFILARFVAGAGAGLIVTTGQVVLADISSPERRGRTIAIYQATFIFAVGVGPFPGGLLAEHYGLPTPFVAYGIAAFLATILAWFGLSETRGWSHGNASMGKAPDLPPFLTQIRQLYSDIGYSLVSLIALMNAVVRTGGLFVLIPLLAVEQLRVSVGDIGFAMMLGSVIGLLAAYPAGWLTDRFGRKAVIVPSTLMTGVSMALFCFAPSYAWFTVAFIVWGVASLVGGTAPSAYAADSAPRGMNAAAMSTFRMTGDAGYFIGPLALGLAADLYGATTAILVSSALLVVVGAIFGVVARETHRGGGHR